MTIAIIAVTALAAAAAQQAPSTPVSLPDQEVAPPSIGVPAKAASKPTLVARPATERYRPLSPAELRVRAANRKATREPVADGYLNAAQVYPYADGAIYHVLTAPEQVTDIALQEGEVLGAVAAGDTVRWVVGDTSSGSGETRRTHVLVKPFTSGLSTNVVITTDRRTYHLALSSTARTAMAAIAWTYPADQLIALRVAANQAHATAPIASGLAVDRLRFDYAITGSSPSWRPLRAFDDGRQTFIEFPSDLGVGEAPPLFLVDGKGTASLVNYRVQGRYYIVDRLFDAAELRLGLKHQDVVRIMRTGASAKQRRGA